MRIIEYEVVTKKHIEESDSRLLHIEQLINAKRRLLLSKQHKLKKISKNNHFLSEIRDDYKKYYGYIAKQKEDQIKALDMLNTYINDLAVSGELSKHNINDSKHEQKKILDEINSIKKGLNEIIQDEDIGGN
jgi:hypothetical protein